MAQIDYDSVANIYDLYATADNVFRCLAPGGRFIGTLHNPRIRRATADGVLRAVGQFRTHYGILVGSGFEQGGDPVVSRLQFFELFGNDITLIWKRVLPMKFTRIEKE